MGTRKGENSHVHRGLDEIDAGKGTDYAAKLSNQRDQFIDILHVPSGEDVRFKAFIDDFQDKYDSSWDDVSVYGRMDPIYQFQGTQRVISLDWHVPAHSSEEAMTNHRKCALLFSMLYPNYEESTPGFSSSTKISTSPIFKVKFGNLIQDPSAGQGGSVEDSGLVGVITGFTYSPDLDLGFIDEGVGNLYPKSVKLSLEFKVLHTHALGWSGQSKRENQFPYGDSPTSPPGTDAARDSASAPRQITEEEWETMTPAEKAQALEEGRADNLPELTEAAESAALE